jgi:hypothetical protein
MPKYRVNARGVESVDLTALRSLYERLSGSLEEITRLAEALDADPTVGDEMLEQRRDQLQDELHAIAKRIAAKKSQDISGARAKAEVLLEWCEEGSDNIIAQLTVSLCRDVLRIARSSGCTGSLPFA